MKNIDETDNITDISIELMLLTNELKDTTDYHTKIQILSKIKEIENKLTKDLENS